MRGPPCLRASPVGHLSKRPITGRTPSKGVRRGQTSGTSDPRRPPWQSLDTGQALSCRNLPAGRRCHHRVKPRRQHRPLTPQGNQADAEPGWAGLAGRGDRDTSG
jgi:hypothetical protein